MCANQNFKITKELKRIIRLRIEECMNNDWLSGVSGYQKKKENIYYEVLRGIDRETAGKAEPFFTADLEKAISVVCNRRKATLSRENKIQRIIRKCQLSDYTVEKKGAYDPDADSQSQSLDFSKRENIGYRFGETPSAYNENPEEIVYYEQLYYCFDVSWHDLLSKGKDGAKLFKVIEFYAEHYDESMTKKAEITALSKYLGESRKRTSELKCKALRHIWDSINPTFSLEKYSNKNNKAQKRSRIIPDKELLQSYSART